MSVPKRQFTPIPTQDGSNTFFSEEFGECFHSRGGAWQEAQQTYVAPTQLAERAKFGNLAILDVCYGLGYNTAAALETIWQVNPDCQVELFALEIDLTVPRAAIAQNSTPPWSARTAQVLSAIAETQAIPSASNPLVTAPIQAQLLLGDARQTIQTLTAQAWQADVIFLDPFSPPRCPQLWTVEFIQQVARCLKPDGRLATYSCAAAVRTALKLAGLSIDSVPTAGRRWPGTVANYEGGLPALPQQEQEHLTTRAAVAYRDPTLSAAADDIQQRRQLEQQTSTLASTGEWRRRWALI
ncbi:hypothetical protein IQ241_10330 [Romeria aff. gracilis LEGE 07310]|uniref:MnmC-like methyltransferase domain-containing protein n=1 Tax=Vasconcelosia minhoensis LEGE 07310 TaxID=915328 RepID=A0A8J7AVG0_9CYAN|nr:MnmC family methyltransferase [Romeria gracilis]MBE9077688.1 hypothetical protein [Romeria aff. gracilis LEGE 07310]